MKIDSSFWDELERRLDKLLDRKLDEKLEEKLEKVLEDKLEQKLEQKLDKVLDKKLEEKLGKGFKERIDRIDAQLTELVKWAKRQDHSIERELTMSVYDHVSRHHPGYITVLPSPKFLGPLVKDPSTNLTITDLDGVLFVTNDLSFVEVAKGTAPLDSYAPKKGTRTFMVIVEAKQHVTAKKVTKKLAQREKIQNIKGSIPALRHVDDFIGLYVGGIELDTGAEARMHAFVDEHKGHDWVGWIDLNGNRFTVKDNLNDYGNAGFLVGGRKRK